MRWPDLFFKSRKPRPVPEIATVPAKPSEINDPDRTAPPARTETAKVGAAMSERDKTESLRALTEMDHEGASTPTAAPAATRPADGRPIPEPDSGNAKTTALPPVIRPNTLSLRQRAKLTDDAHSLPKKQEEKPPSPETPDPKTEGEPPTTKSAEPAPVPETTPAAVVPPAFPVSVETGTILESSTENPAGTGSPVVETPGSAEPASSGLKEVPFPPAEKPGELGRPLTTDTARVHLAPATTSERPSTALEPVKAPADTREKQEFVLANGERILGHVLSETPQTIYLDHATLGVLTLPRSQVAAKPIEVILINGDRIVGDLIAETPDCLYIKHASLGMLTVPHNQRSARVVEAILKDGDRILGEVLAETDHFTVIRSATLGTVAVQHEQVAMLNRKIEQMQLRALPNAAAALEDKKS
jgi:RNase P/RNase MRP subunit p29